MVRIASFAIALIMAVTSSAETWCQCKYADLSHCCVANAASDFNCDTICSWYPECGGEAESIAYFTYMGR